MFLKESDILIGPFPYHLRTGLIILRNGFGCRKRIRSGRVSRSGDIRAKGPASFQKRSEITNTRHADITGYACSRSILILDLESGTPSSLQRYTLPRAAHMPPGMYRPNIENKKIDMPFD